MEENVIVYLGTGCGKTHIAVLLMYELGHLIRKPSKEVCVFLAPTVPLVRQVQPFKWSIFSSGLELWDEGSLFKLLSGVVWLSKIFKWPLTLSQFFLEVAKQWEQSLILAPQLLYLIQLGPCTCFGSNQPFELEIIAFDSVKHPHPFC